MVRSSFMQLPAAWTSTQAQRPARATDPPVLPSVPVDWHDWMHPASHRFRPRQNVSHLGW
jgi:hypothetical protein